ncbi:MAG TPA: carboxypeptidase-like regulatory domain-containing protein, partial [Gemmatimonadaceae bacterium]|nr:carboxypeptidase-like regulatory domain-containing protein [Gemmatimonadaceae bacterium]
MTQLERAIAVATLILLAMHTRAGAQNTTPSTTGVITGLVVDSASNRPIGLANVDVRVAGAPAVVAHTATISDGSFRVEGLQPGRYNIRVRALGYTPRPLPAIELRLASSSYDVGTVTLNAAPVQLQSLQVTGQKQEVQLAPDRNTYIVRDMPTTRGGSALDVLRNVP